MSTIDDAAEVIQGLVDHPETPEIVAQALADAGYLTPAPQIIRTVEELEALDPDTLLIISPDGEDTITVTAGDIIGVIAALSAEGETPPAVVVAPAEQARAARKALEEA